jgi:hypothetical protein
MDKKKSSTWGQGGITGGGTKYDQMKKNINFTIHPESGLNRHKANIKTDKPFDGHIKS